MFELRTGCMNLEHITLWGLIQFEETVFIRKQKNVQIQDFDTEPKPYANNSYVKYDFFRLGKGLNINFCTHFMQKKIRQI